MTSRDELIQRLDAAYEDYRSAVEGLDEPKFDKKWLDGQWGAREITAHITGWLGQLGGGLERMSRGEKPAPEGVDWTADGDRWNATFAEHAKGKKHDQILDELKHGMDSFKKAAMMLPEDRYGEGKTANRIFDGAGILHFKEHADMVRDWRSREGVWPMGHDETNLPSYADLPVKPDAPEGSAWGLFGDDDQLGCLNLLTPERVAAAAMLVRKGTVFPLNLRIDEPNPPLFGRGSVKHTLIDLGGGIARDDYLDNFYPQAASQWDGLRHIRHPRDGFYGGVPDDEIVSGKGRLGIEHFARKGIAGRGVLLDVGRYLESQGTPLDQSGSTIITTETLDACAKAQGVAILAGDILLLRTGWLRWYLEEATPEQKKTMAADSLTALSTPGLGPAEAMAEYLWNLHIAAIAADNPALEVFPATEANGFLHFKLIPHLGMPIGEMWYLEDLAADCAADGVYEFMLTSAPLNVPGGVGSPPNALAIK